MKVKKRNGESKDFDVEKIRRVIKWACDGLNINPLELESNITLQFKNNVKTSDIQEILVATASRLVSIENPDWVYVAGRLEMYQTQREIFKNYKFSYDETQHSFYSFINYMVKNKLYKKEILSAYTEDEITELAKYIKPDYDLGYTVGGAISLKKKYLRKFKNKLIELPQYSDMVNAMLINQFETTDKMQKVIDMYDLIGGRKISLATPLKANMRTPGGNTSSCFIMEIDDNLESLFDCYTKMAYISKAGGGIGVYVSKIRPSKALLLNIPAANAITYWVKIINDIAIAVNQAGVRKGAITVGMDFWHKDSADFIEIKTEIGEFREKSFDIFPQILINKVFMEKKEANEDFWAVDNTEVIAQFGIDLTEVNETEFRHWYPQIEEAYEKGILKNGIKHNAKEFWKRMLTIYIETGDLYINHRDNMNFHNPVKDSGMMIKAGNLCCESFSPIVPSTNYRLVDEDGVSGEVCDTGLTHTCDLLSLNMAEILNDKKILEYSVRKGIRALDNSMDITRTPSPEANKHNAAFRTVGLGTVGVADWMAYNKLSYVKEQDWDKLEKLFETIAYLAFDESCEIAKNKGSFLYYDKANFKDGILLGKTADELMRDSVANLPWDKLIAKIMKYGMGNMLTFSPAPNTSTAVVMGASASYLPVFSRFNYETMSNMAVPIIPKFIKDRFWYYNESFTVPTEKIIKLTTRLQKWVDTGMSMELIINPEITDIKKISDALTEGFNNGLKTVYYSRTLDMTKKDDSDEKPEVSCIGCAN